MLIPICQVGEVTAYYGDVKITPEKIDGWVKNFGEHEKVPIGMGHLNPDFTLAETDKTPLCWISGLCRAGDYCMAMLTDWTPEGQRAALDNEFKNFSIETSGGEEDRIKYVAALGAYDSAVDFKTPDGERFQPFDFTKGALGETGRIMLAAALGVEPMAMPYKTPPARITKLFADEKGPKIWTETFNSAYEKYKDEGRASKIAWGAVENAGYEEGKNGIYRKSKKAAEAAKGVEMAEDQAAKAAEEKKSVLAKLGSLLGIGEAEGDKPQATQELELALIPTRPEPNEALVARVDELEKALAAQKTEFVAASLNAESKEICLATKAAPRFEKPLAQLLALIPPEAEVVLAEADDSEKVVKAPAREVFKNLLLHKGTAKLEDPAALTKPPKQKKIQKFAVPKEGLPEDEGALEELSVKARELSLAEGIPIGEAQAKVLTEYRKEQKEVS